jgi:hypothetical protein
MTPDMIENAPMFTYRPTLRPASFSTLPQGIRWDFVEVPVDVRRPELPLSRHRYGVIAVNRRLTADECDRFGLVLM